MGHPVNFKDMKGVFTFVSYIVLYRSLTDDLPPVIAIVLFVITSLVTSYRCIARYRKKLWGHDDTVALLSLFFFTFFVIGSYAICFRSTARQIMGLTIFCDCRINLSR